MAANPDVAARRHMLVERLLTDVLEIDWWHAHVEAESIGPAVSARVEERLREVLNDPGTCPHGSPIPGSRNQPDQSRALPLASVEGRVQVTRIDAWLEDDTAALRSLEAAGLKPGRVAEVIGVSPEGIGIHMSGGRVVIPLGMAQGVLVTPLDE